MSAGRIINLRNEPLGDAVYIGRAHRRLRLLGSPYMNPYPVGRYTRAESLAMFRQRLRDDPELVERARRELRGKTLACWCHPLSCHGDILAAVADGEEP